MHKQKWHSKCTSLNEPVGMSLTNGLVGTGFRSWYRIQPRVVVFKGLMVYLLIFCKQFMNWTKITDCSRQTTQRNEVYVQYMSTKININNNNNNWRVQGKNRRCHKISVPELTACGACLHPIVSIRDMFRGKNRLSPPEDAVDERLSHGKTGSVLLRTPLMKGYPMEKPA